MQFQAGEGILFFYKMSRPAMGHTQTLIQRIMRVASPRVKQLGLVADHLPQSSAKAKNGWSCNSTIPYNLICTNMDNFTCS